MGFHKALARIRGRNAKSTPPAVIDDQMREMRPLPQGRKEFEEWSERIIAGAMITAKKEHQIFALCTQILALGPTESHKPDAHFIHILRKVAANQVAVTIQHEIKEADTAKRLAEEEAAKLKVVPAEAAQ